MEKARQAETNSRRNPWRKLLFRAVLPLAAIFAAAFLFFGVWLNVRPLPDELVAPPKELVERLGSEYLERAANASPTPSKQAIGTLKIDGLALQQDCVEVLGYALESPAMEQKHLDLLDRHRELLDAFYTMPPEQLNDVRNSLYWLTRMAALDLLAEREPEKKMAIAQSLIGLLNSENESIENNLLGCELELMKSLGQWIGAGINHPESQRKLAEELDKLALLQIERLKNKELVWQDYARERPMVIHALNAPWFSPTYGYFFSYNDPRCWEKLGPIKLPKLGDLFGGSIAAMRNKNKAGAALAAYDEWMLAELHRLSTDPIQESLPMPDIFTNGIQVGVISFCLGQQSARRKTLALCNLNRVGLILLENPDAKPPEGLDFKEAPENPWRDPFYEEPLKIKDDAAWRVIHSPKFQNELSLKVLMRERL